MQKIKDLIATLGFPIVLSGILLYACFVTIERNTQAVSEVNLTITKLCVLIERELVQIRQDR